MKSRTNQLDPRIIGGLRAVLMPNDVLDEKQVTHYPLQLQGMVGYAAECLMDFQNLGTDPSCHLFRIVEVKCGSPFPFRCRVVGHPDAEGDFSFFLPADQVAVYGDEPKKPKARAFTKDEFEDRFKVGDPVRYFVNGSDVLLTGQIVHYAFIPEDPDRSLEIYLAGIGLHKAEWLFNNVYYQPKDSYHFIRFGVGAYE